MTPDSQSVFMMLGADLCVIRLAVCEERPCVPSILVRQRDGRPLLAASGHAGAPPLTPVITPHIDPAQHGSRTVHEACPQRAVPVCTDPEAPWRAARRVFPWDQPQPGCQLGLAARKLQYDLISPTISPRVWVYRCEELL